MLGSVLARRGSAPPPGLCAPGLTEPVGAVARPFGLAACAPPFQTFFFQLLIGPALCGPLPSGAVPASGLLPRWTGAQLRVEVQFRATVVVSPRRRQWPLQLALAVETTAAGVEDWLLVAAAVVAVAAAAAVFPPQLSG